jgi:hypothetical protein
MVGDGRLGRLCWPCAASKTHQFSEQTGVWPLGLIAGVHLIYVNAAGLDRLKRGGSTPYPDGTMFSDDVRDYSAADGVYVQGATRKAITLMVKNSKKYASTGGWGFQAWAGGDPTKPIATDSVKQCFNCRVPQKAQDYTFSKYLE